MQIRTYSSSSHALELASEWLAVQPGEVLILAATRGAADDFARSASQPGRIGLNRGTIAQLAAELALSRTAERGLARLTRLGAVAVASRVTHRLNSETKLEYFSPVIRLPGFSVALASTLSDLRLDGIQPASLETTNAASRDLARLLLAFEQELERQSLADLLEILLMATEVAEKGDHRLLGLPLLILDAPVHSSTHADFIAALSRRSSDSLALMHVSDYRGLRALGGEVLETRPSPGTKPALDRVRRYLFSAERPPDGVFDESVDIFSAPGEGLESVEIARRIRNLANQGTAFDQIAILLRRPERYQPLVEEALRRAGIPFYFSRGSARPHSAGRAFLALLACAAEHCSASRFAEYLSLGEAPAIDPLGAPEASNPEFVPADDELLQAFGSIEIAPEEIDLGVDDPVTPIEWENLLVDAAVIGGRDRWRNRLKGLANELRLQLTEVGDEETVTREMIERQITRLQNLAHFALPIIEMLDSLPRTAKWSVWLESLNALAWNGLRRPESVVSVLSELEPMGEVGPVDIDEVIVVLSERLRFLRRERSGRRYGRVFVGAIDECRGRSVEVVFLPGLAEGLFPSRTFEDPLLLDEARRSISESLKRREDRVTDERLLLHIAVAAARRRLIASYPSMEITQGRPRVPSFYALEIARAIEGRVPALRGFESRTSTNAEARLAWPAPRDPMNAIDNAEYDLAWHAAHLNETGSAHYLVAANPYLAASLRARYQRWGKKWTTADGFVLPEQATKQLIEDKLLTKRSYSPTTLQHFSSCPYRFYLYGIFGLREREEAVSLEQMDPLTRGGLFHEVQFEFLKSWREQPSSDFDQLRPRLDQTLDLVAAKYEEQLVPAIPRAWHTEIEYLRTDLRAWLRLWHAMLSEWEPINFEFAFGLGDRDRDSRDAASQPNAVKLDDGYLVRGSIDMLERHRKTGHLRVTDHKTGKAPFRPPSPLAGGAILQPLLYGVAAEKILGRRTETGRLFYCTQRGGFNVIDVPLNDRARADFYSALQIINKHINDGFLPAAPTERACDFCEFHAVCGPHEETRVNRKEKESLTNLNRLRSLP